MRFKGFDCALAMLALFASAPCALVEAQDAAGAVAAEAGKAEMVEAAKAPEVTEDLAEPDGVAIDFSDPDNWKIFTRGTGTFQFNDTESRQDATEEAMLAAKAALAKFVEERLMVEEQLDKLTEDESKKSKGAGGESATATSKRVKTKLLTIRNAADQILAGLVTLETKVQWSGDSGEVRVTLGQSEKTVEAVKKFLARTRDATSGAQGAAGAAAGRPGAARPGSQLPDSETRRNKTDF